MPFREALRSLFGLFPVAVPLALLIVVTFLFSKRPEWRFALALVAASLAILVLWMGLKRHLAPSNFSERKDFLQLLAQIVGGAALVIGLFFTWWNLRTTQKATTHSLENAQRTLAVSQEGQITERFTRAIENWGTKKLRSDWVESTRLSESQMIRRKTTGQSLKFYRPLS